MSLERCPYCNSNDVHWTDEELFEATKEIKQYFECVDCLSEWVEVYELPNLKEKLDET